MASPRSIQRGAEEIARHLCRVAVDNIAIDSFPVDTNNGCILAAGIGAGIEKYVMSHIAGKNV